MSDIVSTNAKMVKFCPELESEYARYPMSHRKWLDLKATTANGEKAFLKEPNNKNNIVKLDYVYGPGPLGRGYYHIMTRPAYVILYHRLLSQAPPGCCCALDQDSRNNYDQWDDVKRIVRARSVATQPDDQVAAADQIGNARGLVAGTAYANAV
jgi:hypothetical protein